MLVVQSCSLYSGIVIATVLGYTRILNPVLNIASFFHKINFFVGKKSKYVRYTLPGYALSLNIYISPNSFNPIYNLDFITQEQS